MNHPHQMAADWNTQGARGEAKHALYAELTEKNAAALGRMRDLLGEAAAVAMEVDSALSERVRVRDLIQQARRELGTADVRPHPALIDQRIEESA